MISAMRARAQRLKLFLGNWYDVVLESVRADRRLNSPNPLARAGAKTFSQSDEDGITLEILRRLQLSGGTYVEFGVANGLECNTLILAAMGWRGFWISGERLAFDPEQFDPQFFGFCRSWVTNDNLLQLTHSMLDRIKAKNVDVISFDFDGNDLFMVESLLDAGLRPSLFIVEYNARFVPPIRWATALSHSFEWDGTDYFGASLQSFCDMFSRFDYTLVCCNAATGSNAFFIRNDHAAKFADIPTAIEVLYVAPHYPGSVRYGHPQSAATVQRALTIGQAIFAGSENPERAASIR